MAKSCHTKEDLFIKYLCGFMAIVQEKYGSI